MEPYRGLKLRRKKPRFYYPFFFPLFTSTHALINPTEPSPHCNTRRSGLRLPSPEALSLQVEVVTLPALVIQNTAKVCECTCIHLFMAEIKKRNPVFRLTPHCHRLLRTRAQTHAYILHTMFRGLNDGVTVSPVAKEEGQAISMARCTCLMERGKEGWEGRIRGDAKRKVSYKVCLIFMRSGKHFLSISQLYTWNICLSPPLLLAPALIQSTLVSSSLILI